MNIKHLQKAFLIPVAFVILFSLMNIFTFYRDGEHFFMDLYMKMTPGPEEKDNIVLLNIDDLAIAKVGMFPWSRAIMADGLILMKEMGAKYAVFDIEYTEESPMGLNSEFLYNEIPKSLDEKFAEITGNTEGLFNAIVSGNISLSDASEYVAQLNNLSIASKSELYEKIKSVARDNDTYFGQAAAYFGNSFFTINILNQEEDEYSSDLKDWIIENMGIKVRAEENSKLLRGIDIRPAVNQISMNAASLGFPNVHIDNDGVRRRVNLIAEYENTFFPQLSFQAVYKILGEPEIETDKDRIVLKNAVFPDGESLDLVIPLDKDGYFVINWPRKDFDESFTQLSYYYLVLHKRQETLLVQNLEIMKDAGYLNYYQGNMPILDIYNYSQSLQSDMLESGDTEEFSEYQHIRDYFFTETANFLGGDAENSIVARIDQILDSPNVPEAQKERYSEIKISVQTSFSETAELLNNLIKTREILSSTLDGAICYLGWTGTATTDRGVNPFDATYDNVGTHASIANALLNHDFVDILPQWVSIIAAVILVLIYYRIKIMLNPVPSILTGFGFIIFIFFSGLLVFSLTGNYFPVLTPVMTISSSFVILTIVNFLSTSKEKTFIRSAFGQYLSNEVINDLLDNPEKLNLGGEKKNLTALFTDVKGFSTISEAMDPTDLVNLLNMYLTKMSDIIMDRHGTIDKFEGDAIISFFGAPTDFADHAYKACLASIEMKRAEAIMNKKIEDKNLSPNPLLTRIGLNTGDMVVGNMGTAKKMDYTMMGNAVNLAARLEGVNKRYGTWLLISDSTYEAVGKEFATRRLDRVRVVGINTPVRLYELVEEKSQLTKEKKELLQIFEEGLTTFEDRNWTGAEKLFRQALKITSDDGPSLYYLDRCEKYIKEPPRANWDGVYNLTEK